MTQDREHPIDKWISHNSGLVASLLLFLFVLARVVAAAQLDLTLAVALLRASDPISVILGTLMTAFPILIMTLFFFSWYWFVRTFSAASKVASGVLTLGSAFLVPWRLFVFVTITGLGNAAFWLWKFHRDRKRGKQPIGPDPIWIGAVLLPIFVFPLGQMWVPYEVLTVGPDEPFIAHVIEEGDPWITILPANSRTLRYVDGDDVTERILCVQDPAEGQESLISLLVNKELAEVPTCEGALSTLKD